MMTLAAVTLRTSGATLALLLTAGVGVASAQGASKKFRPVTLVDAGSFFVGGTVLTSPGTYDPLNPASGGQTFHGDHAYVQYLIPAGGRDLPLVMWHGGGQMGKTWESTPDGREGFQTIFLRRGFPVYVLDQPRRGRAGRSTVGATLTVTPGEQETFNVFRIGIWPNYFPNVQFPRDPESLDQYFRQQTPNTGPGGNEIIVPAVAALFDKIGAGVLLTHSASGQPGFLTVIAAPEIKGLIAYEPAAFIFPEGEVPPPESGVSSLAVPQADFAKLARLPIQIVYGDNIPTSPSPYGGPERWRVRLKLAAQFVAAVNRRGGDATLLHLPDIGVYGNTHFPFSDLNSLKIADLLSGYLHAKGLDKQKEKQKEKKEKEKEKD
jgi:hypothetical protein